MNNIRPGLDWRSTVYEYSHDSKRSWHHYYYYSPHAWGMEWWVGESHGRIYCQWSKSSSLERQVIVTKISMTHGTRPLEFYYQCALRFFDGVHWLSTRYNIPFRHYSRHKSFMRNLGSCEGLNNSKYIYIYVIHYTMIFRATSHLGRILHAWARSKALETDIYVCSPSSPMQ